MKSFTWQVWDDKSLLNVDFSLICSAYSLKDINMLEKQFLELLQYNVTITASLYASYYFELRTLCEKVQPCTLAHVHNCALRPCHTVHLRRRVQREANASPTRVQRMPFPSQAERDFTLKPLSEQQQNALISRAQEKTEDMQTSSRRWQSLGNGLAGTHIS